MSKKKNRKTKKVSEGHCGLTGCYGKFVKSHILPQAFTRPTIEGAPLHQSTQGEGERRRWTSWYDQNLVTREGEDLLSVIDDNGIKLLKKHQLVWSSWLLFRPHFESISPMYPDHGYREIKKLDAEPIIRFAVSMAWRASASSLPDMIDATLEKNIENQLKEFVLGKAIYGNSPFPVSLFQISTIGLKHNLSPYIDTKMVPTLEGDEDHFVGIMRIYLDGLVFHVHLFPSPVERREDSPAFLGGSDHAVLHSVTYEASFQYENMLHVLRESHPP